MLCCEDGCGYTVVYLARCYHHALEYRRNYPYKARRYDEGALGAETAARNAHGKEILTKLKEAQSGQGQDT